MDKVVRFEVNIDEVEKINPLFSKAKIRVLYTGINRNNTHFSKSAVESALPTIYNIPIVGEYLESKENFGGHGGKIEVTDNGVEYIQTTKPYGVVAESANIYWENVAEKDGTVNEYLVIDGAYLWTGRYDELEDLLNQSYGQSMEIEVQNGEFAIIDGVKTFDIKEFIFSALCILGIDKDGEGHVEPCFESASISAYSLNKEDFKKQFNQMIAELKFSLFDKGGNESVNEKLELLKKYSLTEEDLKVKEINLEDYSAEELEETLKELTSSQTDFSLTGEQFKSELRNELRKEKVVDEWGWEYSRYSYVDYKDSEVYAYDRSDDYKLYGFIFEVNGDKVTINFDSKKRKKFEVVDFEEGTEVEFSAIPQEILEYEIKVVEKKVEEKFNKEKEELQQNYTKLEDEVKSLRQFKEEKLSAERYQKEQELFESFSTELTEEDMKELKEHASEFTLEQIEEKLYTLVGKKKASFSKQPKKEKQSSIKIEVEHKDDEPLVYGGLFEKFLEK